MHVLDLFVVVACVLVVAWAFDETRAIAAAHWRWPVCMAIRVVRYARRRYWVWEWRVQRPTKRARWARERRMGQPRPTSPPAPRSLLVASSSVR